MGASSTWADVGCDKEHHVRTYLLSMLGQNLVVATVVAHLAGPTSYTDVEKAGVINQADAEGDKDAGEDDPDLEACCTPTPEGMARTGWQPELDVRCTSQEA